MATPTYRMTRSRATAAAGVPAGIATHAVGSTAAAAPSNQPQAQNPTDNQEPEQIAGDLTGYETPDDAEASGRRHTTDDGHDRYDLHQAAHYDAEAEPHGLADASDAPDARAAAPRAVDQTSYQAGAGGADHVHYRNPPSHPPGGRRRALSLDSLNGEGRVNLGLRAATQVGQAGVASREPSPDVPDPAIAQAERNLSRDDREVIYRRYQNATVLNDRPDTPSTEHAPEHRALNKGKGPDPRDWGNVVVPQEEADPEVQQAMLNSFGKRLRDDAYQGASRDVYQRGPDNGPSRMSSIIPNAPPNLRDHRARRATSALPIDQLSAHSVLGRMRDIDNARIIDAADENLRYASRAPTHFSAGGHAAPPREYYARDPTYDVRYPIDPVRAQAPENAAERPRSRERNLYDRRRADFDVQRDRRLPPHMERARREQEMLQNNPPHPEPMPVQDARFGEAPDRGRDGFPRRGDMGAHPAAPMAPPAMYPPMQQPAYPPHMAPAGYPYAQNGPYANYAPPNWYQAPPPFMMMQAPKVPLTAPKSYKGNADLKTYTAFHHAATQYCRRGRVPLEEQVEVISPFLEGRAQQYFLGLQAVNSPLIGDLPRFLDGLFNHCFPRNYKAKLRDEIHSFKQGSRSVWEYAYELTYKLDTIGLNDARERVYRFPPKRLSTPTRWCPERRLRLAIRTSPETTESSPDDSDDDSDDSDNENDAAAPAKSASETRRTSEDEFEGMPDLQTLSGSSDMSYSDLPDLQSITTRSRDPWAENYCSSDSEDDCVDEPDMDEDVAARLRRTQHMEDELSDVVAQALNAGAPYPGDGASVPLAGEVVEPGERFELIKVDCQDAQYEPIYTIYDHYQHDMETVPIAELRNPSFNIGLWYAEIRSRRSELIDAEQALVHWMHAHPAESTSIGRGFEQRMEFILHMGEPYPSDDPTDAPGFNRMNRFSVQRDPRSHEYLLVTDLRRNIMRSVRSSEAETPGFDLVSCPKRNFIVLSLARPTSTAAPIIRLRLVQARGNEWHRSPPTYILSEMFGGNGKRENYADVERQL
ncbi:hypothetical protein DFP72DRAFT_858902 [Ephemerocybe angulata]|uniref:Retrotransposon gag domain-containing protein n=1 Tax=Ephemerocybe angulata TaxID=980116 RepID=A0A8H6HAB7_9AGAR|nr:hypothetical protein DFP72DRAFT_858902 [Tulosesus angulatus]